MEIFLVSALAVAVAEIGDKTQFLAIALAARFRAAVPVVLGILAATVLNHTLAAFAGAALGDFLSSDRLRLILAVSFAAMGIWCLWPDKADAAPKVTDRAGAFVATTISFFLLEIGDKTQLATVALAAHYHNVAIVALGTTAGMLIADVPAVYLGTIAAEKIPLGFARKAAAAIFLVLAAVTVIAG